MYIFVCASCGCVLRCSPVLCCAVLCCAVLCCLVSCGVVSCGVVMYRTALHCLTVPVPYRAALIIRYVVLLTCHAARARAATTSQPGSFEPEGSHPTL